MFGDVNTALRDGAREQRIVRVNDEAAQDLLGALGTRVSPVGARYRISAWPYRCAGVIDCVGDRA